MDFADGPERWTGEMDLAMDQSDGIDHRLELTPSQVHISQPYCITQRIPINLGASS